MRKGKGDKAADGLPFTWDDLKAEIERQKREEIAADGQSTATPFTGPDVASPGHGSSRSGGEDDGESFQHVAD